MKKLKLLLSLFVLLAFKAGAQNFEKENKQTDTLQFYQSVYNLRPVLLHKGQMLANLQLVFPHFYKIYNPQTKSIGKVSDKLVLNESYFDGYFTYGLSGKVNLYALLPMVNVHHVSPMLIQTGVGVGDIQTGIDYQLSGFDKNKNNALSVEFAITFPTGRYNNIDWSKGEYPTGLGSFRFKPVINGLHKFTKLDLWYSVYYEYRTNHSGVKKGDEAGFYSALQKKIQTPVGQFGVEGGLNGYYNFKDTKGGNEVPQSSDYALDIYAGGWYKYLNRFYLRFGVPFSMYQNGAWFTKYKVMVQVDYLIK